MLKGQRKFTLATSSMVNASSSSPHLLAKVVISNRLVPAFQAPSDHHIGRKTALTVLRDTALLLHFAQTPFSSTPVAKMAHSSHLKVSCRQQTLSILHLPHGGSLRLSFDLIRNNPGPTPLSGRIRASDIGSVALCKDSADQIKSLGGFRRPC
jgi:hypothetical protein